VGTGATLPNCATDGIELPEAYNGGKHGRDEAAAGGLKCSSTHILGHANNIKRGGICGGGCRTSVPEIR